MTGFFKDDPGEGDTPLNAIAPWSLDIDTLVDFDAFSGAAWATKDSLERLAD